MFAAFLTTIFFSISVVCGQRSAKLIGGTEANFWRLTCATFFLGIWAHLWGKGLAGESFLVFVWSGVVGIGIGDVALFQALPRLGARLTLLILQCLTAPFAALIEWLWLGTTLALAQMSCALIILLGVGIALSPSEHLHIPRRDFVNGIFASIIAAFGGAYGMVLSRRASEIVHTHGPHIDGATAAYQRLFGGLFIAGVCLLIVKRRAIKAQLQDGSSRGLDEATKQKWQRVWPWVLANALAGQTLGVSCLQWALEHYPTGVVLPITAITPLVVIPFTRVFEGEQPTIRSLIGGVIAVGGAVALTLVS